MPDLLFQNFSTVQSNQQPNPVTVASAATVAPVGLVTFLSGTVSVATITPPVTGAHVLVFVFTNASPAAFTAGTLPGQPKNALAPAQNIPVLAVFDPVTQLYWMK